MEKTRQEICLAALTAANNAKEDESGAEAMTLAQLHQEALTAYRECEKALEGLDICSSEQAEALRLARETYKAAGKQCFAASERRYHNAGWAYMAQHEADAIAAILPTTPTTTRRQGGRL